MARTKQTARRCTAKKEERGYGAVPSKKAKPDFEPVHPYSRKEGKVEQVECDPNKTLVEKHLANLGIPTNEHGLVRVVEGDNKLRVQFIGKLCAVTLSVYGKDETHYHRFVRNFTTAEGRKMLFKDLENPYNHLGYLEGLCRKFITDADRVADLFGEVKIASDVDDVAELLEKL